MKSLEQQIKVMQWYLNGGQVEKSYLGRYKWKDFLKDDSFNFEDWDYRIKEEKKTINIEKWLVFIEEDNEYKTLETSNINSYSQSTYKQIKLLESYEVEL